jgi:6-phosphogluconolactonase
MLQRLAVGVRIFSLARKRGDGFGNSGWNSRGVRAVALGCLTGIVALTGCGKFFPPLTSGGGGGSNSGDYLYVGNQGTNPLTVAGFSIASAALSDISGSPFSVSLSPTAIAVTPNNDLLYMGSAEGDIYVYTIGSNGALTLGNSGTPVASGVDPAVLRVDSTGTWLLGADALAGQAYVFQIGSGGVLTAISSSVVTLNATTPANDMEITPSGDYVYVSCGTAGIYTLSFDSSNGALAQVNSVLAPKQSGDADFGMAVAPSGNYLFAAETGIGAVRVFSISSSNGTISEVTGSPYKTATGPFGVLVDSTGSYVYVSNRTEGTISAFTISSTGTLTAITGSPFATGELPEEMVEDNSKTYLAVVNEGGNPDLELFTIGSTGALTKLTTATTGTDPTEASSIAATH